jgi:hypothetical protein
MTGLQGSADVAAKHLVPDDFRKNQHICIVRGANRMIGNAFSMRIAYAD